jgi:hypothetical protein
VFAKLEEGFYAPILMAVLSFHRGIKSLLQFKGGGIVPMKGTPPYEPRP